MELLLLIISAVLNLLLLALLFFKSAINEVLERLFSSWYDARERRKDMLRRLYNEIELLPNHLFMWLTAGLIYEYGSLEEREQGKEMMDRNYRDVDRILGFIWANRLEFPSSVRQVLVELFQAIQAGDVIQADKVEWRVLSKRIDAVSMATQRVRRVVRAELE